MCAVERCRWFQEQLDGVKIMEEIDLRLLAAKYVCRHDEEIEELERQQKAKGARGKSFWRLSGIKGAKARELQQLKDGVLDVPDLTFKKNVNALAAWDSSSLPYLNSLVRMKNVKEVPEDDMPVDMPGSSLVDVECP